MTDIDLIAHLRKLVASKTDCHLLSQDGAYPRRWMPAVSIRKKTIREIIEALKAKE
jgi:hypothetical protein